MPLVLSGGDEAALDPVGTPPGPVLHVARLHLVHDVAAHVVHAGVGLARALGQVAELGVGVVGGVDVPDAARVAEQSVRVRLVNLGDGVSGPGGRAFVGRGRGVLFGLGLRLGSAGNWPKYY